MGTTGRPGTFAYPSAHARRSIRFGTAILCGVVGVLYLILTFLVADAEAAFPGATDSTWGAYLYGAILYLVGAGLIAAIDRWFVWAVGAAVQVIVIGIFVMFGVGVFGPGVFEYEALSELPMEVWAVGITGAQVVLFGLMCYLAATTSR